MTPILVGSGTAAADDPDLTCRLPGLAGRSPVRIVLDSKARLAPTSKLATTARQVPVWLVCTSAAPAASREVCRRQAWRSSRSRPTARAGSTSRRRRRRSAQRGLTRVLVEGGGQVAAAFLKAGLVDRISSYRAGLVLGGDGRSAVGDLGFNRLDFAPRFSAGFGALAGRRHAGNLGKRDLSTSMFTGIVTDIGEITSVSPGGQADDRRFVVRTRHDMAPIAIGASIACSGCCLTVLEKGTDWFAVEVSGETLGKTHLGELEAGQPPQPRTVAEAGRRAGRPPGLWPCRRHGRRSCR